MERLVKKILFIIFLIAIISSFLKGETRIGLAIFFIILIYFRFLK